MFGTKVDDVDSSIINITRDGEDFAWFLSDIVTDKQVEKVVDLLNEQDTTIKRQGKVNEQQEKEYQEQYSKIQKLQKRIELLESLIPKELIEE